MNAIDLISSDANFEGPISPAVPIRVANDFDFDVVFPLDLMLPDGSDVVGTVMSKRDLINLWNVTPECVSIGILGDYIGDRTVTIIYAADVDPITYIKTRPEISAQATISIDNGDALNIAFDLQTDGGDNSPSDGKSVFVDWGDGNVESFQFNESDNQMTHEYADTGNYVVKFYYNVKVTHFYANNNLLAAITFDILSADITAMNLNANALEGFDASTIPPKVNYFYAQNNQLSSGAIDAILEQLDANGVENGDVKLDGQTPAAVPSEDAMSAATNLVNKGWDVNYDAES